MANQQPPQMQTWPRVKWTRAGQLAQLVGDGVDLAAVADAPPPAAFRTLRGIDRVQAVGFIAQCLPRINAAEWMEACLQRSAMPADPRRAEAREAVSRWVRDPSDKLRRHAFEAGERAGFDTVEGIACLAVFFSGGSLAPATQEQGVQPPAGVFGKTIAGAVKLASLTDGALAYQDRLEEALDLAEIAATGGPLPPPAPRLPVPAEAEAR